MNLYFQRVLLVLVVLCSTLSSAHAKPKINAQVDAAAADKSAKILSEEYVTGDFGGANRKLDDILQQCDTHGCRPETLARVIVVQGMVASQMGDLSRANERFGRALQLSPNAALPARGQTPNIKKQWADAVRASKSDDGPKQIESGTLVLPEGWKSADAFKLALEATDAKEKEKYQLCVDKDKASIELDDQPRTHLHLSSCLYRLGKLKEALAEAQIALETGIGRKDADLMRVARERVKQLVERMPRVTFNPPAGVEGLEVTFDDREVPTEALGKTFSVDPGPHRVRAKGLVNGFPSDFDETVTIKESELVTVVLKLTPRDTQITPQQVDCMYRAKSQEDVLKCLPQKRRSLVVRLGTDVGAYSDTNNVYVVTPGANASISSPTAGWNIGGNVLVDVLSAASPDIVSYASPPYRETRYGGGIGGGYKYGNVGAEANASISSEPDYLSRTVGGAVTYEMADKTITPRLGLSYSNDIIGRGPFRLCDAQSTDDTGRNPCKRPFTSIAPEAGVTMVLSPTSLLMVGASLQFERGDQSKPYRHVPMFSRNNTDPAICEGSNTCVRPGQSIETVDRARLAIRPIEQLPMSRDRYALAGRYIKRFASSMTLRVEERVYYDSWAVFGSTTDARYLIDLGKRVRVWPHARFHWQTAANFYQLAYTSVENPEAGAPTVPTYRTTDRELQGMIGLTGGGGTRIDLARPDASIRPALTFTADLMYNYYFASLFLRGRTALYGTLAFDVEF